MAAFEGEIGVIGLGVMGQSLLFNLADRGFAVVGYTRDQAKAQRLRAEVAGRRLSAVETLADLAASLRRPRAVLLLVPAGAPVDTTLAELLPWLEAGDVVIDGGNSHFPDTERRQQLAAEKGLLYLGLGVSGGEAGARHGPSMMPGGPREAYERVRPILEAVAARVDGEPCVAYLGPGSAGHFVKMIHNGIEYGLMQLIAETYALLKGAVGLNNDELYSTYARWNYGEMSSYLLEITTKIFQQDDDLTGGRLVDFILDEARQKGTGAWTSEAALALQVPVPNIDVAVTMRNLSGLRDERLAASRALPGPGLKYIGRREEFVEQVRQAYFAAALTTYAQGMALLSAASRERGYELDLEAVARIWRGGCIIRAAILEPMRAAYQARPDLSNLLLDSYLGGQVAQCQVAWRTVVGEAARLGIAAPGMMASLAYYDAYRSAWSPANLIQAQRDFFGAHTYARTDREGKFHTQWEPE
ncbi:MAG: NADP-dependent phosphogluconate dehydrogenase [Chloroflexota bacterium]